MNNLNNVESIINSLNENLDFLTLKEDYAISPKDLNKITTALTKEAEEIDNMGIIIQYEIWEIIIIDAIDRYISKRYSVKTGKEIPMPEIYATECARKSIADSSPVDIPNIEYTNKDNLEDNYLEKKYKRH